jgi:hypothetical protein
MEDTKSNDRSPLMINNQISQRPLSASGPTGEVRQGAIGFGERDDADIDGDDGQHISASECFEGKSGVGDPKSSHVKSVLMRHVQTRHIPYYAQGFYKKWN